MEFQDQQINCADCGGVFTFTAGEQEFYSRKGFSSPPKRCKPCRESRRQTRGSDRGGGEGVYRAPGFRDEMERPYRGPREQVGSSGGGRGERGGGAGRPQHEIVCAACGQKATVPFRPAQGKPVYCRDCYASKKGETIGNR